MISRSRIRIAAACLAASGAVAPSLASAQQESARLMVPGALGVTSASELDGATICFTLGSAAEILVSDYFAANAMQYGAVVHETARESLDAYLEAQCDVFAGDAESIDEAHRMTNAPDDHLILAEVFPQGAITK